MQFSALVILFFTLLALGIFLLVSYGYISSANSKVELGSTLSKAIMGIFTVGIIFLISAIFILFFCSQTDCASVADFGIKTYLSFIGTLGIVMATLGGIIVNDGDSSDSKSHSLAISILVIGIVFALLIGGFVAYYSSKHGGISAWFKSLKSGLGSSKSKSTNTAFNLNDTSSQLQIKIKHNLTDIQSTENFLKSYMEQTSNLNIQDSHLQSLSTTLYDDPQKVESFKRQLEANQKEREKILKLEEPLKAELDQLRENIRLNCTSLYTKPGVHEMKECKDYLGAKALVPSAAPAMAQQPAPNPKNPAPAGLPAPGLPAPGLPPTLPTTGLPTRSDVEDTKLKLELAKDQKLIHELQLQQQKKEKEQRKGDRLLHKSLI